MDTLKNDPRVAGWDHICSLGASTCTICDNPVLITSTPWSAELGTTSGYAPVQNIEDKLTPVAKAKLMAAADDTLKVIR